MQYLKGIKAVFDQMERNFVWFSFSDYENVAYMPHWNGYVIQQVSSINLSNGSFFITPKRMDGKNMTEYEIQSIDWVGASNEIRLYANKQTEEFMERLYSDVYNYLIGEENLTEEEFLVVALEK